MEKVNNSILLIEDNLNNLEVFTEIFELDGYQVLSSKNGRGGIYLTKFKKPNIIISDIRLPDISGFDLLKYFKTNTKTREIPFLFLSAFSEKTMIKKGLELGAADYLVKPCSMEKMLSTVKGIIMPFS